MNAVWSCGSDKALGLDKFTFKFFKNYWNLMKEDIISFVKHFEQFRKFACCCKSSFFILVLKIKGPLKLRDYLPISLIAGLYKIVAKLLVVRLKGLSGSI